MVAVSEVKDDVGFRGLFFENRARVESAGNDLDVGVFCG